MWRWLVAIGPAALVCCFGVEMHADKPNAGHIYYANRHLGDDRSYKSQTAAQKRRSHSKHRKSQTRDSKKSPHLTHHKQPADALKKKASESHPRHYTARPDKGSHMRHHKSRAVAPVRRQSLHWHYRHPRAWYPNHNYGRTYRIFQYYGPVDYGIYARRYLFPYAPYPSDIVYPGWYSPLYMPAERVYGPEAVKRFMGLDRPNVVLQGSNFLEPAIEEEHVTDDIGRRDQRATNRDAVALGRRFIGFGDARFANQQYRDAYQSYRRASQAAPRLAEAYFRQCYALTSMGSYSTAVTALRRGLSIDPDWSRSEFDPDKLYGENKIAKEAHIENLKKVAAEKPLNPDLAVLLGLMLYFDGKIDQAGVEFRRASKLLGADGAKFLGGFLEIAE